MIPVNRCVVVRTRNEEKHARKSLLVPVTLALGSSGHKKKRAGENESPLACLPRARPFSLSPTNSKRLLRRLKWLEQNKPRPSYFRVTNETVLNLSSMFSIYMPNLINRTNVTSVGKVYYLEGGGGGGGRADANLRRITDHNSKDHIIVPINGGLQL